MIRSVAAIAKMPSLKASSLAVSLLMTRIVASATDGPALLFATGLARGRHQEHRLRPRRLRVPRDDGRHDAAHAALPAVRGALLVRSADRDGGLRRVRVRRNRRAASVRKPRSEERRVGKE